MTNKVKAYERSVTVRDFAEHKRKGEKLVVMTAYDALFGRLVDESGVRRAGRRVLAEVGCYRLLFGSSRPRLAADDLVLGIDVAQGHGKRNRHEVAPPHVLGPNGAWVIAAQATENPSRAAGFRRALTVEDRERFADSVVCARERVD